MRPCIFACLFITIFLTGAQTKTHIGVKMGEGASTAYMRHSVFQVAMNIDWSPGFNGGLLLTHFPNKYHTDLNTGIQLGVNYVQKGWVQNFEDTSEPNHKTRINYLEIPVDAVIYFGNQTKYYLSVGFYLEYVLKAKVDPIPSIAAVQAGSELMSVGISDFYRYNIGRDNRLSYGPRGAVGVFRETNIGVFRLEGFLSFSVRSVFDYEPLETQIPDLSLNYGLGMSVAYLFSFGKLEL